MLPLSGYRHHFPFEQAGNPRLSGTISKSPADFPHQRVHTLPRIVSRTGMRSTKELVSHFTGKIIEQKSHLWPQGSYCEPIVHELKKLGQ